MGYVQDIWDTCRIYERAAKSMTLELIFKISEKRETKVLQTPDENRVFKSVEKLTTGTFFLADGPIFSIRNAINTVCKAIVCTTLARSRQPHEFRKFKKISKLLLDLLANNQMI